VILLFVYLQESKLVLCHHGMARHQITDGGESPQMCRVAANILNKKPTMGGTPAWRLVMGLTIHGKKTACY
jgi:hypothetical protein